MLNVVGELHLKAIATLAKRTITMYLNSGEKEHYHPNENNKSVVPNFLQLEMKMKEHTSTSFLPLVYSFLVGRGQKFFEKCGAKMYGLCQGDFGDKITCSTCGQKYHKHCIEVSAEPFKCGCHVPMPYQLKE